MTLTRKNRPTGFTLIEATVVLACIAILGTIWAINIRRAKEISTRRKCVSNLKSAALSLKIYASDHNDHYAWQVEPDISFSTPLATMNLADRTTNSIADCAAWAQWGCLSNELGSPKILLCSGNRLKKNSIATDWSTSEFRGFFAKRGFDRMHRVHHGMDLISYNREVGYDTSISYFLNLDADESIPAGILCGDANVSWISPGLGGDLDQRNPMRAGLQVITGQAGENLSFVSGRQQGHYRRHGLEGNIALADGSVQQVTSEQLRQTFSISTNAIGSPLLNLLIPQ
jgi:type II secretory pathway pseudopilin PulG